MFATLILSVLLTLNVPQTPTLAYGRLVASGPGYLLVEDQPGVVVPFTCPPSWCEAPDVGKMVWIEGTGLESEVVSYCPVEDTCGSDAGGY